MVVEALFLEVVELAFGFRHGGVQVYLTLTTHSTPVIKLVLNASGLTVYSASYLKQDIQIQGEKKWVRCLIPMQSFGM
jgi:hypothetical protein